MSRSLVLSRARLLALALAAAVLALVAGQVAGRRADNNASAAVGGVHMTMTVTGHKTGLFKGDDITRSKATAGSITVIAYQYELVSPRDPASGQATGKRIHKPVTITHEMGGSSPEFLGAAATNETLDSVVINFFRTDRSGKDVNYYRVKLTNGSVSDVKQYSSGNDVLEDISFTFQKIEQDEFSAKRSFVDNWEAPIT
jgi:type VI secretion system secreted protein Hcp